jgi:uncharacterized protein YbjT (DUF2867 family)
MYVIIGASGNTGSVVTDKLLAQGKKVRAVGRNAEHLTSRFKKVEPFVGDVTDKGAMTKAFAGAEAVYLMLPPNLSTQDYFNYEKQVEDAFATAITKNSVKYAVTLSSIGADKPERTGPVLGLRHLEERLNQISGLNVLHIRAGYFMENTLGQAAAIKMTGGAAGPLHPNLKLPMIATQDIGDFAADALLRLEFAGQQTQELHGQRDLSFGEATSIIGKAIGKPDLKYSRVTSAQFQQVLVQTGMTEHLAGLLAEMAEALDSGHVRALEPRSARNTTPTMYEMFVQNEFLSAYQEKAAA